jgi:dsDNA-specific endonuclease/ATPase MutS2
MSKSFLFSIGTEVFIPHLNKNGIVLAYEKRKVKVSCAGTEFLVPESALLDFSQEKKKKSKPGKPLTSKSSPVTAFPKSSPLRVDLHGMNSLEARDACEQALNRALQEHYEKLEIVHGHGKGILAKVCFEYFSKSRHARKVETLVENPGVLVVYL